MATYNQSDILYSSATTTYNQVSATISRTATGSGTGSSSATPLVTAIRSATGAGTGTSSVTQLTIVVRTATGSGAGSSSSAEVLIKVRTATGSGAGTSSSVSVHVLVRTGSGSGQGTATAASTLTSIRSATGSGTGTQTAIGARLKTETATGSGASVDIFAVWMKSHIFRVPFTYTYPGATYRDEGAANRLQRYNRTNVRVRNLYELTDGSYTTVDQRDQGQVAKLWQGGHDHYLTDAEVVELTTAGFGASIT